MTNDINTLNGALAELGETLATNISSKGVSASAGDGLTGLANKVLNINQNTLMLLLSNRDIIQSGDEYELIYRLPDINGVADSGKSVDFIQKSIQILKDDGKSTSSNIFVSSDCTITRNTDDVSVTGGTVARLGKSSYYGVFNTSQDFIIEFDYLSANTITFYFNDGNSSRVTPQIIPTISNSWITARFEYDASTKGVKYYENNVLKKTDTVEFTKEYGGFQFQDWQGDMNIKYKNFKILANDKVYPIIDTLFSDTGVTGSANPNWYDNNYGSVSVGSDGTLLTSNNTTNFLMHNASNSTHTSSDQYIWNAPFIVEFDVVSMSGTGTDTQFQVYSDETVKNWATGLTGTGHYKAIVLEGNQQLYKDGELQTNAQSYSLPNCRITLRVKNNVSLKYKNFKVYEIAENSITNSNGIATCNLIGNGSGEETYYAKANNIVSNDIGIIDGIFHDKAVIGSSSSDWYNGSNRIVPTVQSNGTLLETSSNNGYWFANLKDTSTGSTANVRDYTTPICVEVDLVEVDTTYVGNSQYYGLMFNDGTDHRLALKDIDPNAKHLKIKLDGVNAVCYADTLDEPVTIPLALTGNFAISLMVRSASYMKYKNFVIYPIPNED